MQRATIDGDDGLMTARAVAERLQVTPGTVYEWGRTGRLGVVRLGRLRRFRPADVDALIESGCTREARDA